MHALVILANLSVDAVLAVVGASSHELLSISNGRLLA